MTITNNLSCNPLGATTKLSLQDSTFDGAHLVFETCTLTIATAEFVNSLVNLGDNITLAADRLHFHDGARIQFVGSNARINFTNSIFDDVTFELETDDTASSSSTLNFAFDTFVFTTQDNQFVCPTDQPSMFRTTYFEDNIMVALAPPVAQPTVVTGTSCTLSHNVLFPQPSMPADNIVADPQFVSTTDFHLKPTSPAVNAAMPSTGLTSDHDFDGTARPQGSAPDIGAYELKP